MTEKNVKETDKLQEELRGGIWIFFLLMLFTAGEFLVASVAPAVGWVLLIAALAKAYFVVIDYMHFGRLFSSEEEVEG